MQDFERQTPDERFSPLISFWKPHEAVTLVLIGRWKRKFVDKESIPQYPCSWWNGAGIFWNSTDCLQCCKIVAIVTSGFTISLSHSCPNLNFLHCFTQKSANNKTKWATKSWTWNITHKKKRTYQVLINFHCHIGPCQDVNFFMTHLTITSESLNKDFNRSLTNNA